MKQYILVSGVDFEFSGVNFKIFCNSRTKKIISNNVSKEDIIIFNYDFPSGLIKKTEITYLKGVAKEKSETLPTKFTPITQKDYEKNGHLKDNINGIMSIIDIYSKINEIGKSPDAGTLCELHFFSHGWMGGPVLVNSFEDRMYQNTSIRDPYDRDPRTKDFDAVNMDSIYIDEVRKAFNPNSYIWIWGCTFTKNVHDILTIVEKNKEYNNSGIADDIIFKLGKLTDDQINSINSALRTTIPLKTEVDLTFKEIKQYFCKKLFSTFSSNISHNFNIKTYGALVGTYAEYEKTSLPLMRITPILFKHVNFYKNHLKMEVDKENRNYGLYLPTLTCNYI